MSLSYAGSDLTPLGRLFVRLVENLSGQALMKKAYKRYKLLDHSDSARFFRNAAIALHLEIDVHPRSLEYIPETGPLLIVANHPYGAMDGLAIAASVETRRSDLCIIIWDAIDVPEANEHFLALDLAENSRKALRQNVLIRRKAISHLRSGGAILLFPSGCVERSASPWHTPCEQPWTPLAGRLAREGGARILPVYVPGHNSRLFHMASFMGDTVRRALFLHETARLIGKRVRLHIGKALSLVTLLVDDSDQQLTEKMRLLVMKEQPSSGTTVLDSNDQLHHPVQ